MNREPHIALLMPGFPADESDSTCLPYIQSIVRAISKSVKVTVFSFQYPFSKTPYKWHNVHVIPMGGANKKGIAKPLLWRRVQRTVKQVHAENPFTHIHAYWLRECALVGVGLSKKMNLPFIITMMGQDAQAGNRYVKSSIVANATLVALSQRQQSIFEQAHAFRCDAVIPLGAERAAVHDVERDIDVLGVGSLVEVKRWEEFINAIAQLKSDRPRLRVQLIGEGALEQQLKSYAAQQGLEGFIEWTGLLPHDEVLRRMNRSKILLHSSSYESFGMVFSEAFQMGMCVVSDEVGWALPSAHWKVGPPSTWPDSIQSFLDDLPELPNNDFMTVEEVASNYLSLYGRNV